MSNEEKTAYLVKGTSIRLNRKTYGIGRRISLTDEDAIRLKAFIEPLQDDATARDGDEDVLAQQRQLDDLILQRNDLAGELRKHQEAMATLLDEHKADLQDRDKTIADLQTELDASDEANRILTESLADRDNTITLRSETISDLNKQLIKLNEALAKKEGGKK
ncbi:hypothetical protein KI809_15730 [Geobacter pelophilus]|uniref:Uncharacterized protein n=1 Tax=Geoanaerobacter pelophilus TaxID=60036 RepID=A0AAW4L7D8_9BACT|nr:hypothetical protein [Geoanaerobacter pelophilus]MBT0665760.1 hypothetical protein [Geoanaerobacter pelophilus]